MLLLSELFFFLITKDIVQVGCLEMEDTYSSWWGVSSVWCLLLPSCSGLRDSGCMINTCSYLKSVVKIAKDFSLLWLIHCPLICISRNKILWEWLIQDLTEIFLLVWMCKNLAESLSPVFKLLLGHNCIVSTKTSILAVFGFSKLAAGWLRWPAIRINNCFAGETCA